MDLKDSTNKVGVADHHNNNDAFKAQSDLKFSANGQVLREKKKTKRRTASQIVKQYQCLFCPKRFGSEAANIMHMRKKHNMGTKTDMLRDGERKLIGYDPL